MVFLDIVYLSMNRNRSYASVTEAYGGHHAGDRTAHKVLQSVFYWPTLFKDARNLSCLVMNVKELVILVDVKKCL